MKRAVLIEVDFSLLETLLKLSPDHKIILARGQADVAEQSSVMLMIEGPTCPTVLAGDKVMIGRLHYEDGDEFAFVGI